MKSIIIFGKGPSVLKCTREMVEQHDDIAIINYPVLNNFFYKLISKREIKYHFCNCGTFDERYTNKVNKLLNIQNYMNTNTGVNQYSLYLNNKDTIFDNSIYNEYVSTFKDENGYKPSSGLVAFNYILNTNEYNKITLVGFDNFEKKTQRYYFEPQYINPSLRYLFNQGVITKDGKIGEDPTFEHSPKKTYNYLIDTIKNNENIKFTFITNMKFSNSFSNLIII